MTAQAWLQRYVGNRLVTAILRSPLKGLLSRRVMLLTVAGRRTGRRYTLPVGFVPNDGALLVLVAGRGTKCWWRNLEKEVPVRLLLRGRSLGASAEALTFESDSRRFTTALRNYVARNPGGAQAVGIRDVEDVDGLRSVTSQVAMVIIHPTPARIRCEFPSSLAGEGQGRES